MKKVNHRQIVLRLLPADSVGAEIGVWKGDFSARILDVVRPRRLHLIDPWRFADDDAHSRAWYGKRQQAGQAEMDDIHRQVRRRFRWPRLRGQVRVHRTTSLEAAARFDDRYFDWVYIDGDHLYEAVRGDLEAWRPKVKPGGMVVVDDYGVPGWWDDGVTRAVDEIAASGALRHAATHGSQAVLVVPDGSDPAAGGPHRVASVATRGAVAGEHGGRSGSSGRSDGPDTDTLSVLVVGMPKTGTSAVYASLKQAGDFLSIYEVGNVGQVRYLARHADRNRLAKVLVPRLVDIEPELGVFRQRIVTVRDPRDVVVSWLLYRPFLHDNHLNEPFVRDLIEALERKEASPRDVSLQELHSVFERHQVPITRMSDYKSWLALEERFTIQNPGAPIVRYEDYLRGDLEVVEEQLGLKLSSRARLGSYNDFNERAKSSEGWRHWFTESDVERYRPLFAPYLERHGYGDDWVLADDPTIDPDVSSRHVRKNVDRLVDQPPSTGSLLAAEKYTPDRIDLLRAACEDGREPSIVELALAHRDGLGVDRDPARAVELLQDVAARGNPLAMVHLGLAHRKGIGVARDEEQASRLFKSAAEVRGNLRVKAMMRKLDAGWSAVA